MEKGDVKLKKKDEEKLLKLLGSKGTKQMLELLSERGTAQYDEMLLPLSTPTLNKRLSELLAFGLIEHPFERMEIREEWYRLTEKGKKILECMRSIIEVAEK